MQNDRLTIMWITPECPYPANTGGRVGIWNRIINLAPRHQLVLYTICDNAEEMRFKDEIEEYGLHVKFFQREKGIGTLIKSLKYPYPAVSRWSNQLKMTLENDFDKLHPDFVIVDFPQMMGVLPVNILSQGKIILELHNIEFQAMRSLAEGLSGVKKEIYKIVSKQMHTYENRIYNENIIKLYLFISSKEKEFFEKTYGKTNTLLSPPGAEVRQSQILSNCHNLMFAGKMSYPANEEAAIWLVKKVLPYVLKKVPDAMLYLVGKDPQEKLYEIVGKNEHIIITGTVDSMQPYYDRCNLVVVPVLTGGGVNIKLLEALGQNKYVVSTYKGIEGTSFVPNKELHVTDEPDKFADYCIDFLLRPNVKENLEMKKQAYQTMMKKYSWQGIMKNFEDKLRTLK